MDFNLATHNLSLYVDDMQPQLVGKEGEGPQDDQAEDGMWESVIIKKDMVKDWNVLSK